MKLKVHVPAFPYHSEYYMPETQSGYGEQGWQGPLQRTS